METSSIVAPRNNKKHHNIFSPYGAPWLHSLPKPKLKNTKKIQYKIFFIFQEMQLSGSKIKKILFQEMECSSSKILNKMIFL